MSVSDNVEKLSTTTPLDAFEVFTSDRVMVGNYTSLSMLGYASSVTTTKYEFSGDGVNFNFFRSQTLEADRGTSEVISVISKWVRLIVANTTAVPQTYLRVFTYGNVEEAAASSEEGVTIDNFPLTPFNALSISELVPQVQYLFTFGTNGSVNPKTWVLPFTEIKGYSNFGHANVFVNNGFVSIE